MTSNPKYKDTLFPPTFRIEDGVPLFFGLEVKWMGYFHHRTIIFIFVYRPEYPLSQIPTQNSRKFLVKFKVFLEKILGCIVLKKHKLSYNLNANKFLIHFQKIIKELFNFKFYYSLIHIQLEMFAFVKQWLMFGK